jgi:hypothetical protein
VFSLELYADLPITLTIVHCDGTYTLSLHIGDQREAYDLVAQGTMERKAIAQGRRVAGDYSHDDFWSRESILEVGGTYLSKTPRIREMPESPGASDATDAYARCGENARCNNATSYGPNTSQRRQLHSSERRTERMGPAVEELGTDWKEVQGLSYVLFLETLKLVLLTSVIIVQVSIALAEGIDLRLSEGPGVPKLEHKEGWMGTRLEEDEKKKDKKEVQDKRNLADSTTDLTDDIKGFTDRKEPVRTRKQSQASVKSSTDCERSVTDKDFQPTHQGTFANMTGSTDHPQPATAMLYMPMPPPRTLGSPMFEGANVTEFLERYKDLCSDYWVSDEDRLTRLLRYCI